VPGCTQSRMRQLSSDRVIGVDACRKGWVGITSDLRGYFAASIGQLVDAVDRSGPLSVVAIDIPIGLPLTGPRQADVLARRLVGRRSSSVFPTPTRAALTAATYAEASALTVEATGKGLSRQAFALGRRILEVDAWARSTPHQVIEVHPEVCFASMAGHPLTHPKSTWAGVGERRRLLERAGFDVPADIGPAGESAAVDDVLDAAAAAWTAKRYVTGAAVALPEPPEQLDDGVSAAIWA
jgi:predicted RNase H-like nuclease